MQANFQLDLQGRTHQGGTRGTCPSGGREVPQLIEGSESCQPEVKASKTKCKWYSVARKRAPQLLGKCAPHWLGPPRLKNPASTPEYIS